MRLSIHSFGRSITGRRRRNEDAFLLAPETGVFAVLDGMGGYDGGDVASSIAAQTITQFYAALAADPEATWPYALDIGKTIAQNRVDAAIRLANRRIRERRDQQLGSMGSTVALMSVVGSRGVLGHLGDSRIYRLRGRQLLQLTCDHSLYEQLRAGGLELPPLSEFLHANVITRALGPCEDEHPELAEIELELGDRFLLCTDGLSGVLEPDAIATLLAFGTCQQACDALIDAAYEAGSRDNITAIVVDVVQR
ncbi:MAG TPA: protein phosphatase 2C domain-containing protein [Enhygromyxa sp.]|nr:protein phosphatase 2C domain-containing protein [Enhygromyxa sp.]